MVSRRHQTALPNAGRSVRFYKFVALSFLGLTLILLSVIVFMSSKRATITVITKKNQVNVSSDIVVGAGADHTLSGTVTTTLVTLEQTFSPTGNREEPGKAEGLVTLHNETETPQTLVATTRLLTPEGILFRLKDAATIPANGTVRAAVVADQLGETGNIAASRFTIPGLNEAKQKVIYATSDSSMTGGIRSIGIVSPSDIDKAKKLFEGALTKEGETALRKLFPDSAAVFSLVTSTIVSTIPVGTEVSDFQLQGTARVLGVFYAPTDLKDWARAQMMKKAIDEAEIISPSESEPTATFGSYAPESNSATLHVFYDGNVTLNPESKQLSKSAFFGKTADEVRRYLLSLDHVQKVEVEFRPVWMRTVPPIADHVTVIVKEVQ